MPGLLWTLVGVDKASPTFARVAGAADRTAAATLRAQKNTEGALAGMSRAGATLTKKLTVPLLAVGAVAVDQAAKFQKATSVYVTAAGESAKNLDVVRAGIKKTAVETGTSISQLTSAQYLLEKAGMHGAGGLKLLNAAAKGATEENANLADVVQGATSIMASYHLGTDKSVQVINALKTAAGSSKSTMEDYIKSLSTVIPIAQAAGIALPQVLAAVSTLTRHGTTPAEATQELSNTIRGLQAPSNVAIAAMNQLGVASVDLSKNLSKRGLTGTLEYIESKLPKSGLVYLTTMKQMEAGTADLTVMQSKMTPQLRQLSEGFLKGSVSLKNYRAGYKALGAEGAAQGSAFQNLALKVKGYNDNIKNGTPAQKTMASELKAVYGGANGLNTVLQLGGKNLAGFKQTTVAVGKSLSDTAKDVEGWKRTSELASVQAARFKESLRVLAINAGTAALPALTKLAHGATSLVTAFQGLPSAQKKMLAWSAGLLIAVGPVLAIGGRLMALGGAIARFSTFAIANLARFSTRMALSATGITTGMSRVGAALGGAAIGAAVGTLTANSSAAVKAVGVLGSAAAGAAIGLGTGTGAIGAVVGGLAGGLSALATQFLGAGGAAKQAIKPTDEYTNALRSDSDAVGKNTQELIANKLEKAGLYDAGLKLGISQRQLTLAASGNTTALAGVQARMQGATLAALTAEGAHKGLTRAQQTNIDAANKLSNGLGVLKTTLDVNTRAANNVDAGLGKVKHSAGAAAGSLGGLQGALNGTKGGVVDLGSHANNLGKNLAALAQGHHVNVDTAQAQQRLADVRAQLAGIQSKTVQVQVETYNSTKGAGKVKVAATGGHITGPGTGTSDSIPARLSNGEFVVKASQTKKHLSLLQSINSGAQGFAKGGVVGGIRYSTNLGYHNALARAAQHRNTSDASSVSSAIGGIGQSYSPPFSVADVGIGRLQATIGAAIRTLSVQMGKGLAAATARGFRAQIAGLTKIANQQLTSLRVKIKGSDLAALRGALKGTADDTRTAFAQILTDVSRAGGSRSVLGRLGAAGNRLVGLQNTIASARDYGTSIGDTLRGAYDPTKAGSIADLHAGLTGATGQNKAYASQLSSLRSRTKGNAALTGLINQLAASGNTATLATLAGASKAELAQTSKDVAAYNSSVGAGVNAATVEKYGKTQAQMQQQQAEILKATAALVSAIATQPTVLEIDGERFSTKVVRSKAFNKAFADLERHLK